RGRQSAHSLQIRASGPEKEKRMRDFTWSVGVFTVVAFLITDLLIRHHEPLMERSAKVNGSLWRSRHNRVLLAGCMAHVASSISDCGGSQTERLSRVLTFRRRFCVSAGSTESGKSFELKGRLFEGCSAPPGPTSNIIGECDVDSRLGLPSIA